MSDQKVYTFIDPAPLARTVVLWLYIHLGAVVLFGVMSAASVAAASEDDASKAGVVIGLGLAAILMLAALAVMGFLILKWIYRVSRNAHSAAKGLTISPPWAVGWYFVPVATLWKPFQALREAWQASTDAQNWRAVPTPAILRWWWGLFLLSNVLGQISFRISSLPGGEVAGSTLDVITTFVDVPLNLVFIAIVRELTRRQVADLTFGGEVVVPA